MAMTYEDFEQKAMSIAIAKGWRCGQALFNCLLHEWPELAERIRGGTHDPFHAPSFESPQFLAAREFIKAAFKRRGDQL
jgi:hypothetical protein